MPTFSGAVLLADGVAATNAVVELHNAGGDVVDETLVDQRGCFTFHVPPETWREMGWDAMGIAGEASLGLRTICISSC